jgi:hypothetical protein
MFHIPELCARHAERAMTRVSAACFGVHFFAGKSIVNSPLRCWALDAERERLRKSLCARLNVPFTVARRACAIAISNCRGISFSAPSAAHGRLSDRQRAHDFATGYLWNCRALAQMACRDLRLISLAIDPDPEKFRGGIFEPTLLMEQTHAARARRSL